MTRKDPARRLRDTGLRHPSVLADAEGRLILAYLTAEGDGTYHLRAAPLRLDPRTGVPRVDEAGTRELARGCQGLAPLGSPDGRHVTVLVRAGPSSAPRRLILPDLGGMDRNSRAVAELRGASASSLGSTASDADTVASTEGS